MSKKTKIAMVFGLCSVLIAGCSQTLNATPNPPSNASLKNKNGVTQVPPVGDKPRWVIAIHGGAGVKQRKLMSKDMEREYRQVLTESLSAGAEILATGGKGMFAVEAALKVLEDSPIYNAGRGSALDEHGTVKHDASIMRGDTMDAGAVAGSSKIRNPISAALKVMERTDNVMLNGDGADWFAAQQGLTMASPLFFITEERRAMLLKKRNQINSANLTAPDASTFGTIGAVVLDSEGNLTAGTSTGGRTNKRYGRIGDSPIIGAGTYASNRSCAVSATGHGEFFMRYTVARDICARVEFANESLEQAAHALVVDTLKPIGGRGAVIAIDPQGKVVFSMNGRGAYRGVMTSKIPARTAIYLDEEVK